MIPRLFEVPEQARENMSAGSRRRWDDMQSGEREKYRELMRRSMHVRWHVKRDLVKPDCEFCQ